MLSAFTLLLVSTAIRIDKELTYVRERQVDLWSPYQNALSPPSKGVVNWDGSYERRALPAESRFYSDLGEARDMPGFVIFRWDSIDATGALRSTFRAPMISPWLGFESLRATSGDRLIFDSAALDETDSKVKRRLARVTFYWPEEGDSYTKRRMSSTGVYLEDGHCAVDPKVIPYGSVVKIPGIGEFVAVDTGPAVVSRRAARAIGRTREEQNALVVDVYCSNRSKARVLEASARKFAAVTWTW